MNSFTLLNGIQVAKERETRLRDEFSNLKSKAKLAIIQVGLRPDSTKYVEHKKRFAERVGVEVCQILIPETITENELREEIKKLNEDKSINGIIIQLPIPAHLQSHVILDAINPKKDVDGMTSHNLRLLYENKDTIIPATTLGILSLLNEYKIPLAKKHVVIVGRSSLVGKPTALLFLNKDATVTVCHSQTENLSSFTSQADILIVAVGIPNFIKKENVKNGATVIDVGINVKEDGKVAGDVCFDDVKEVASYITPVPGGVGPMTIVSLFENLLKVSKP